MEGIFVMGHVLLPLTRIGAQCLQPLFFLHKTCFPSIVLEGWMTLLSEAGRQNCRSGDGDFSGGGWEHWRARDCRLGVWMLKLLLGPSPLLVTVFPFHPTSSHSLFFVLTYSPSSFLSSVPPLLPPQTLVQWCLGGAEHITFFFKKRSYLYHAFCTKLPFSWVVKDFALRPISSTPEVALLCRKICPVLFPCLGNSNNLLLKSCYVYLFCLIL